MGCGSSKVMPDVPKKGQSKPSNDRLQKKDSSEPIYKSSKQQTTGSSQETDSRVIGGDYSTTQRNRRAVPGGPVAREVHGLDETTAVTTLATTIYQGSLHLTVSHSHDTFPKLEHASTSSVRKSISKHRASVDLQELLGLKIPQQLYEGAQGGYLPTQNKQAEAATNSSQLMKGVTLSSNARMSKLAGIAEQSEPVERKARKDGAVVNNRIGGAVAEAVVTGEEQTEKYTRISRKPVVHGDEEYNFILESLKNNSVFYSLSEEQVDEVINQMFLCETKKDDYLFRQGDKAFAFFVVRQGRIAIEIDGVDKKELSTGTGVGELALLYSAPRSASIKCKTNCQFWAIDRSTFRKIVEEMVQRDFSRNRKFMESVPFFSFLSEQQKDSIASALISVRFKGNDTIVSEGDRADSFYLIKEGKVAVWKNDQIIRNLYQNDSFGEQALYVKSTRAATVKADGEVKLLSLGRDDLTRILGGEIQKIVYANRQRWAYNNNQLLLKLTNIQVEKILMNTKISNYKSGTVLYEAGDCCDTLIAVLDGQIKGENSQQVLADKGNIFGDFYLPTANHNLQFSEKIIIGSDSVLSTISFKQFLKCIGGDIHAVIAKNADSHEVKMKKDDDRPDYTHIKLEDLIHIKKLGVGQFGSVYLVRRRNTRELYALKSVSKGQIIEQNLEKHLLSEKAVLEIAHFPFIMPFIRSFKDEQSVYFLLKFIRGMELFDVIRDIGLLSTFDSQFYIGSLILSLEYLHSRSVIYRDIKPENIMIDQTGYLSLIDMGAAKVMPKNKTTARTFTIIGTPHYMAPEIIKGKGYSFNSDLWSVGVCLYEFMCGGMPYAEDASDPYEIYEEINTKDLKFPGFLKDRKARLLIEQLLQKQPELRLGGSYAALKTHTWFDNFEWDSLYNKTIQAPFTPPEDKLISPDLIEKQNKKGKSVIEKIKKEQQNDPIKYNKANAKDPYWDKSF